MPKISKSDAKRLVSLDAKLAELHAALAPHALAFLKAYKASSGFHSVVEQDTDGGYNRNLHAVSPDGDVGPKAPQAQVETANRSRAYGQLARVLANHFSES